MAVVCHYLWTWHLSACHLSWSPWRSTFMSHVTPLSLSKECIVHCRMMSLSRSLRLPNLLSCHPMFKGYLKTVYLCSLHSLCVSIFESIIWLLHSHHSITMCWVSCRRCGTHHGPPSTRLFPSTSAHHPGNSLRNKKLSTLRSVCLNDRFSRSRHRFRSLTFDR